jgi:hypothetical protein
MITLVSDKAVLLADFELREDMILKQLLVAKDESVLLRFRFRSGVGSRWFVSDWQTLSDPAPDVLPLIADLRYTRGEYFEFDPNTTAEFLRMSANHPGICLLSEGVYQKVGLAWDAYIASQRKLGQAVKQLTGADSFCDLAVEKPREFSAYYVYSLHHLWMSRHTLKRDQWLAMIEHKNLKEAALIASLSGNGSSSAQETGRGIAVEVRREVWRRDGGRCSNCGSRERLEFDHIIPFALGGSNTARNVQLLCELCNREKGATLG